MPFNNKIRSVFQSKANIQLWCSVLNVQCSFTLTGRTFTKKYQTNMYIMYIPIKTISVQNRDWKYKQVNTKTLNKQRKINFKRFQ